MISNIHGFFCFSKFKISSDLRKYIDDGIEIIKEDIQEMILENGTQINRTGRSMSDGKLMNRYSHSSAISHLEVEVKKKYIKTKNNIKGFG